MHLDNERSKVLARHVKHKLRRPHFICDKWYRKVHRLAQAERSVPQDAAQELGSPVRRGRKRTDYSSDSPESTKRRKLSDAKDQLEAFAGGEEQTTELLADLILSTNVGNDALDIILQHPRVKEALGTDMATKEQIEYALQLQQNVVELLGALGPSSHTRKPLVHFLSQHLPLHVAAKILQMSSRTISYARALNEDDLKDTLTFSIKRLRRKFSTHFTNAELEDFKLFLEEYLGVPSGSQEEKFVQQQTDSNL